MSTNQKISFKVDPRTQSGRIMTTPNHRTRIQLSVAGAVSTQAGLKIAFDRATT